MKDTIRWGILGTGNIAFRITNDPCRLGQNDCVSASVPPKRVAVGDTPIDCTAYTDPSSPKPPALPPALPAAASLDPPDPGPYGAALAPQLPPRPQLRKPTRHGPRKRCRVPPRRPKNRAPPP